MSGLGISLSAKEAPIADRLLIGDDLTVYHGAPTRLTRFVRVLINGVIGRIYFEELSPAEDEAYQLRYYDFANQQQAALDAAAKAAQSKQRAKEAKSVADQMTRHNMALLAQLSVEGERRTAVLQEKAQLQAKLDAEIVAHAEVQARLHTQIQEVEARCVQLSAELRILQAPQVGVVQESAPISAAQ